MIKVFTKATFFDRSIQVTICRGNDPHIDANGSHAADPIEFALLKKS